MSASLCKYCGSDLCRGECWTPRHDLIKSLEHPVAEKLAEAVRDYLAIKASPQDRESRGELVSLACESMRAALAEFEKKKEKRES